MLHKVNFKWAKQYNQDNFIFFTHLPIEKNYSRDQINKSQESRAKSQMSW